MLLLLLPVQIEQLEVRALLTSVYPVNTGQSLPSSQTLKLTAPFEYVQHRILTAPAKQRFHVFSSTRSVVCCLWLSKGRTCANRAARGRDSLDERVSTQNGTSAVLLTEIEAHCSIRVGAAKKTDCPPATTIIIITRSFNQSDVVQ